MKTLYLSTNEKKADEVKDFMLDYMWSQVQIKYTDENCYLILEDETRIDNPTQIIQALKAKDLPTKIKTATIAAKKAYNQFKSQGFIRASEELVAERRSICNSCPYSKTKLFTQVCTECGCHIKTKTLLISESCPLNKW